MCIKTGAWCPEAIGVAVQFSFRALAVMAALACAGCGGNDEEVKELRTEMAQLKEEVRELRQRLEQRHAPFSKPGTSRQWLDGTNGVRRVQDAGGKVVSAEEHLKRRLKMQEELEARRKAMQDPEFRKKFEAERKQRMDERRRMHEERLREVRARHEAAKPKAPESPADQAK